MGFPAKILPNRLPINGSRIALFLNTEVRNSFEIKLEKILTNKTVAIINGNELIIDFIAFIDAFFILIKKFENY